MTSAEVAEIEASVAALPRLTRDALLYERARLRQRRQRWGLGRVDQAFLGLVEAELVLTQVGFYEREERLVELLGDVTAALFADWEAARAAPK